jgi:hypothetical protein
MLTLNHVLHSKTILLKEPNPLEIKGQQAIKDLMKLRYLATYGDYLAENCKRILPSCYLAWNPWCKYFRWRSILDRGPRENDEENLAYDRWCANGKRGRFDQPTTNAILDACLRPASFFSGIIVASSRATLL